MYLSFLVSQLSETLVGARVDKIHQPTRSELVFVMRTRGGVHRLFLSADANAPRVCLVRSAPENPQNPPMLCMLLRKKLTGAALTAVEQSGLDRVVFFRFDATDEIGDRVRLTLVSEIMAQHSNLILLDENDRVVDAVKRVDAEKSSYRLVLPGAPYKLPPAQQKLDLREQEPAAVCEAVTAQNGRLSSAVLKTVQGVSPLLAREIAFRADPDDGAACDLSADGKLRLLAALADLRGRLTGNAPEPTLVLNEEGKPFEFSFLPVRQYGPAYRTEPRADVSALLEDFYAERDRLQRTKSRASELFTSLDNLIERTSRKLNNRREDLARCEDRETLRKNAELITAAQYRLQKGADVYEVEDYYNANAPVRVKVDPALTPSQNAQKLYKEYRKACTAEKKLRDLIAEGEDDLAYLIGVRDLLQRASLEKEFAEIKAELVAQGFLKPKRAGGKKQVSAAALPPLSFTTSQGFTVLVGRNNTQNDKLTFKTGKKGDVWLHAQKAPGSHVLLVADGKDVPDDAIVEAAEIAAYYSSVSAATLATVDYTDVKNIKKPNGAKPGFVVYYTYYSVNVRPKKPDGGK